MTSPESAIPDIPIEIASFEIRNRGPWTTVEYHHWPDYTVGHTTRLSAGASINFENGKVMEKLSTLGFPRGHHHAEQVHGSRSVCVEGPSACHRGVDGLVSEGATKISSPSLFVRTADCLPVYLLSCDDSDYALVHAGWRGLVNTIFPAVLDHFFDGPVELFVGPHIPQNTYEVGPEVLSAVEDCLHMTRSELVEADIVDSQRHLDLFQVFLILVSRWDGKVKKIWRSPMSTPQSNPVPLPSYRENQGRERMVHWFFSDHARGNYL